MESSLPAPLQAILDKEAKRERRAETYAPMRHYMEFEADGRSLASFTSLGPTLIPTVGQQIELHGVRLVVVGVEPVYELHEDGEPVVFVAIAVELPADNIEKSGART